MLNRLVKTIALAIPLLIIGGCASTGPRTFGLDPSSAALVRQTCTDIMGLHAGFVEFDACGESLANMMLIQREADQIAQANARCEQQGLSYGSVELAKCVVLSKRAESSSASAQRALPPVAEPAPRNSYFSVSHSEQTERAELSCAHLGLHPASVGFKHCVFGLKDAVFYTTQNRLQ